jgi:hypothetical protein
MTLGLTIMPQSDIDYWLMRASEERLAAEACVDPKVRNAHNTMANRYIKAARGGTILASADQASGALREPRKIGRPFFRSPDMTLYHLNIFNMRGEVRDQDGTEFASLPAAHTAALAGIRTLLGHEAAAGRMDLRGRLEVVQDSEIVLTVLFEDAIEILRA